VGEVVSELLDRELEGVGNEFGFTRKLERNSEDDDTEGLQSFKFSGEVHLFVSIISA
jgi:hypothetical protein